MSRHSKRNTASSFFTTFERTLLKKDYGTLRGRLASTSFRDFDACKLCLARSRDPVACPSNGDLFCRECIIENLLVQRQEIKRYEKGLERKKREEEESEVLQDEEVKERNVRDFELVQMGLSVAKPGSVGNIVGRKDGKVIIEEHKKGEKRKFELDEEELIRIAKEDREKAKKALTEEKLAASKRGASNFWVPSLAPSTGQSDLSPQGRKLSTVCPASDPDHTHPLSLKSLVSITFSEDPEAKTKDGHPRRICPSCKKTLNNNVKSYLAPVCGHVTCATCTALIRDSGACFVCDTRFKKSKKEKEGKPSKKDKDKIGDVDGLIELQVEGSGYAAGIKGPEVELKRQTFG